MIRMCDLLSELQIEHSMKIGTCNETYSSVEIYNPNYGVLQHTLYIVNSSDLPKELPLIPHIGLLIIGEPTQILKNSACEYSIIPKQVPTKELYYKAKSCFADLMSLEREKALLTEALISKLPLGGILKIASEFFGNPVVLYEPSSKPLAFSDKQEIVNLNDPLMAESIIKGHISAHTMNSTQLDIIKSLENLKNSKTPQVWPKCEFRKHEHIMMRVLSNDYMRAHLCVIVAHCPFTKSHEKLLVFLSTIISLALERDYTINEIIFMPENQFLLDLYLEKYSSENELMLSAHYDKLQKADRYIAMCIKTKSGDNHDIALSATNRWFKEFLPSFQAIALPNKIIALAGFNNIQQLQTSQIDLSDFLRKNELLLAISNGFSNLTSFHYFANQAEELLDIGKLRDPSKNLFDFPSYYYPYIIHILAGSAPIELICISELTKLKEYDQKNETDLFKTIYIYLKCGCNVAKAADELFIHRNTMMRRIDRFYELTGIDLSDSKEMFNLYMSFEILNELYQR